MPTTANNETLERIRAGKLAIENDGTKEQLQDITTLIWPNDGYPSGNRKYYQTKPDEGFRWLGYTYTNLPTIKATELLAMIEDKENVYEVYYNGKWHIETEENYKELVNNANCYGRINGINQGDILDAIHSDTEEKDKYLSDLEKRLGLLPYEKHVDDGQYNDGVVTGFEMGADWVYTSHVEPLQSEITRLKEENRQTLEASQDFAEDFAMGFLNYTMHRTWHDMSEEQKNRVKKMLDDYRKAL